jgi:hypothetical protein
LTGKEKAILHCLTVTNFDTGGGLRKSVDSSKRFMGAGNGNAGSQLDSGQSSLDVKEGDLQEDALDFVTKAFNPFGKSYSSSSV